MTNEPYFSIVIPTLNEEVTLPQLLRDLTEQTFQNFEVIHVDGSSEDETVKEAHLFTSKLSIVSKVVKKRNVAHQRNAGGKLAKASWIVFMDADNRLPKYFLEGLKYQITKHELENTVDIFTTQVTLRKNNILEKLAERTINTGLNIYEKLGKEAGFGAMIGVRKKIFQKIKYNENQKIFEDSIFIQDVIAAGYSYQLFSEPKYKYSLRRLDAEGVLNLLKIAAQANSRFLRGKDFEKDDYGYVMKGGKYYEKKRKRK